MQERTVPSCSLKEALHYEQLADDQVRCNLCPHQCLLKPDQRGVCRARVNQDGQLYSLNYGRVASLGIDPIEKKPLYHYFPGSLILSAGTFGCNLSCPFCQNYSIAHEEPETHSISPAELAEIAGRYRDDGSIGVAFTYNEPSVWFEYVAESARLLNEIGQQVVLVSNGHIEAEPLQELLPLVAAMNIDVKAFQPDFYRHLCRGSLEAVKERVAQAARQTHVEITTLLIPEENDSLDDIEAMAAWLADIDPCIPLHLSRYHPAWKFDRPPTPLQTLLEAREAAEHHLKFVYIGNVSGEDNNTYCLRCQKALILRSGYQTEVIGIGAGRCLHCGADVSYIVDR